MENQSKPIEYYLNHERYSTVLQNIIEAYHTHRKNLVIPSGCKLRRVPEDKLEELKLFTVDGLTSEFRAIVEKRSNMPKVLRDTVTSYVVRAIQKIYRDELVKARAINKKKNHDSKEESRGTSTDA